MLLGYWIRTNNCFSPNTFIKQTPFLYIIVILSLQINYTSNWHWDFLQITIIFLYIDNVMSFVPKVSEMVELVNKYFKDAIQSEVQQIYKIL